MSEHIHLRMLFNVLYLQERSLTVMLITKQLKVNGSSQVNAVLINDEGEEYPVFLDSLHNTLIFPELMGSGYTLKSLPYGFVKDGVAVEDLPVEVYSVNDQVLERMYNTIGASVGMDELKKHVDTSAADAGLPTPPTNYTIKTRAEFLEYLELISSATVDDDFMPLNYFVAPEARFTLEEYFNNDNHKWIQLISGRRRMSLKKFHKLIDWLLKINLMPNYGVQDVLDAYFAWGVDGLQFKPIDKHREPRTLRLTTSRSQAVPVIRNTYGLIDGLGNLLTPNNEQDVVWKLAFTDPTYVQRITEGMKPSETRTVNYRAAAKIDVTVLEGSQYQVQYSADMLLFQLHSYPSIEVLSPASTNTTLSLDLALPAAKERLYEHCALQALANTVVKIRKPTTKISSYDALRTCGANPQTAFDYIITKFNLSAERQTVSEDSMPVITQADAMNFLAGRPLPDDIKGFFQDVLDGVFNIDNVATGKQVEASITSESVFQELYAIHNVLGVSLQEIYDQLRMLPENASAMVFQKGDLTYSLDVSTMRFSRNGYLQDVQSYDLQNARDCTFFTYITMVAREVGINECRRHVGIEFLMVDKNKAQVQELLKYLEDMYTDHVTRTIPSAQEQTKLLQHIHMFALSRFFEMGLKGTITLPKALGGVVQTVDMGKASTARAYMQKKIENLTTYCSFTVQSDSTKKLSFNAYCVNAYVTPEYIIPRGTSPIHEVPFYAAFHNWNRTNPTFRAQLVGAGVLPPDFQSWDDRYLDESFMVRDVLEFDKPDSLFYYYDNAQEEVANYPADRDFVAVTHPMEYMFPGLYADDLEADLLPTPRKEPIVIRQGFWRDITVEDYRDLLYPSEEKVEQDQYIVEFKGFDAEAFFVTTDVLDKIPAEDKVPITVIRRTDSLYLSDTQQLVDFRQLENLDPDKYPVIHLYGRNYMLRAADGKLWEARI